MAARRYCPSAAPTGKEASAVQAILDRLGRAEAQLLRGRDLDRGAGRRIAAFAGCRFLDLELVEEQMKRVPGGAPKLRILRRPESIFDYRFDDFAVEDYAPQAHISAPVAV